ncbi:phosphatidylinositol N-acetylglucosaminyltransferase subunit Y-domain-containing protein [Blastocladiella britannica]|nr:phosphatidylinositol N-acetylglucosaminyltransferase subunit Y-domain-containing protein [Blastocladiella britannica]
MDEEAIAATLFGSLGPRGFLALVTCTFALWVYAAIVSKLLPPTGYWMLDAIQADHYFCYMVPLTLPVTVYFVIWNWFGLKLYKHN